MEPEAANSKTDNANSKIEELATRIEELEARMRRLEHMTGVGSPHNLVRREVKR